MLFQWNIGESFLHKSTYHAILVRHNKNTSIYTQNPAKLKLNRATRIQISNMPHLAHNYRNKNTNERHAFKFGTQL